MNNNENQTNKNEATTVATLAQQESSRNRAIKTVLISVCTMISVNFVSEALKISLLAKPATQVHVSVAMDDKNQLHVQSTTVDKKPIEKLAEKPKKSFRIGEYQVKTLHHYKPVKTVSTEL